MASQWDRVLAVKLAVHDRWRVCFCTMVSSGLVFITGSCVKWQVTDLNVNCSCIVFMSRFTIIDPHLTDEGSSIALLKKSKS